MPLVSVVVTTFNRKKLLAETINSILSQSFQDFELIVIDNFSNYDFFALIKSFNSEKIIAFQNHNNGIIAINRNFGIKLAKGTYVAFCDDDDIWFKEKLEKQVDYAKENTKSIVSSFREIIDDDNSFIRLEKWRYAKPYSIYYRNKIALSSVFVELSKDIYFDTRQEFIAMEDYALWLKLFHLGYNIHFIPEPLIKYREGITSFGRNYTFLPPKEIACLSEIIILYKERASMFHYVCAVINKIFYFARYLLKNGIH
jgi:teichuronic acid biosynthesis glycosyltransferase TuaG